MRELGPELRSEVEALLNSLLSACKGHGHELVMQAAARLLAGAGASCGFGSVEMHHLLDEASPATLCGADHSPTRKQEAIDAAALAALLSR